MKTPGLVGAATLLLLGVGFLVFCYNLWAYSCGHCTLQTLYSFGPLGWLLLAATGLAGLSLLWLRARRLRQGSARRCPCGAPREAAWVFCPSCGQAANPPKAA